jgi:hypothetical protein
MSISSLPNGDILKRKYNDYLILKNKLEKVKSIMLGAINQIRSEADYESLSDSSEKSMLDSNEIDITNFILG